MTLPLRQRVLGGALAATVAATVWVATQPGDDAASLVAPVQPVRRPAAAASAPSTPAAVRQPWAEATAEQLSAWQPAPPPVAPPPPAVVAQVAAPAPPSAPPPPYQMIGRLVEGEGAQAVEVALLTGPNRAFSVKRGDVIDGQWRVEQIGSNGVSLTWLPARIPQNIVFKAVP